jgi:hypothetical protein
LGFDLPLATALYETFLLRCSTAVEQAETQLRVVVPIEEEEEYQKVHVLKYITLSHSVH